MSFNRHLFSSLSGDWRTPKALYQALDAEFHFDYDPCPSHPTDDGLTVGWGARSFVNPPYGRGIGKWVKKGYEEACLGKVVVMLLPARTDTAWFQDYVLLSQDIRFIRGRLRFNDALQGAAPFPSMIVVFDTPGQIGKMREGPRPR